MPEITAHLTMTHGLFPNAVLPDAWVSFLGSAWSLSTEWQFYLLVALIAGRDGWLCWTLLGLAAAGVAWRLSVPDAWQFSRAFLANKSHFFALGMASVGLVRQQQGALLRYGLILSGCLAICATEGPVSKMLPPLVWTFFLAVQMRPGITGLHLAARLLRSQTAQYLGAISYCLYLINEPIHKLTGLALGWIANGDAASVHTALDPSFRRIAGAGSGLAAHACRSTRSTPSPLVLSLISVLFRRAPSVQGDRRRL